MDIAIVIPSLEKYGGAERVAIACAENWQHRHAITIYSTTIDEALLREHGIGGGVKLRRLTPYFAGEHSMLLNAILLPKIWRREIGRHDIYFAHLWPTHLIDLHPMVWYPHEPLRVLHDLRFEHNIQRVGDGVARNIHVYPKYNYDRIGDSPYEAYLSAIDAMDRTARPDRVVANSRYTSLYLESVYGAPVHDVVYPGVDVDDFIDLPIDRNLFVTIGQLWPHKRVNLLIEAISMTDEAQLVVIGSGPEGDRLAELAVRLGVQDRVFFMSGLTNREMRLILARANAFLFAPIKEPFGIAILEAMVASMAVIAVNEGGFLEVCTEESAFLLPPFPSIFSEKIAYLQNNPEVAERMGRVGREIARNYSWSKAADTLEGILVDVANEYVAKQTPHLPHGSSLTRIGVQYYLWYGEGYGAAHWNDNPRSGAVRDRPMLNLHIDSGGPNPIELVGIQHVFDLAARRKRKFELAIQISAYGASTEDLQRVIRMIETLYAKRDNYLTLNGRPVLFWFWSGVLDGDPTYVKTCSIAAENFCNVAASLRLPAGAEESRLTFGMFDGMTPFSPLELSSAEQWETVWADAYAASEKANFPVRVATICPGYDDHALDDNDRRGNPYRDVPRRAGDTYKRGMAFVETLAGPPDLIVISTFNEFHENTHIEPSTFHGDLYVELTRDFVSRLKKQGERP
jgi:glycosyltransferase involved in cell wall biosynthesis